MKVGLIDADIMWTKRANGRRYGKSKADIYPNLAIMKLSAWHKAKGDDVDWWSGLEWYDVVYISKVFSTTPDLLHEVANADRVLYGGSGFCIRLVDGIEQYIEPPKYRGGAKLNT